jgi:hypothetical protein
VIKEPKPLITFCLFTASISSPPLTVLKDPFNLDDDLKRCAKAYVQQHVRLNVVKNTIEMPEIFRYYWKDFGGTRNSMFQLLKEYHTSAFNKALVCNFFHFG